MSDHKFEKQVQQKLEELRLNPSASSWEAIEAGLRPQKRRRAPMWLPVLLLLIAGGSYYFYSTNTSGTSLAVKEKNASEQKSTFKKNNDGQESNQVNKEDKTAAETGPLTKSNSAPEAAADNKISAPQTSAGEDQASIARKKERLTSAFSTNKGKPAATNAEQAAVTPSSHKKAGVIRRSYSQAEPLHSNRKDIAVQNPRSKNNAPVNDLKNDATAHDNNTDPSMLQDEAEKNLQDNISHADKTRPSTDSSFKNNNVKTNPFRGVAGTDTINATAKNAAGKISVPAARGKKKASKWQWGVSASAGMASVVDGDFLDVFALNADKAMVEDVAVSPTFNSPNYGGNYYTPTTIKPGLSYSFAFFVSRNLSKRFSLSTGLSYIQYNTSSKIGGRIDRNQIVNNGASGYLNVSRYYSNDKFQNYRTYYNFIELPLNASIQLNKSDRLPVYWNAGLSISRMISSNSLHFDGTTGVYYSNNELLNKTQTGITTGFSIAVFNKSRYPLWIGPSVRYNVSPMLKKDVSESKHLTSFGLDLKLFLKK